MTFTRDDISKAMERIEEKRYRNVLDDRLLTVLERTASWVEYRYDDDPPGVRHGVDAKTFDFANDPVGRVLFEG